MAVSYANTINTARHLLTPAHVSFVVPNLCHIQGETDITCRFEMAMDFVRFNTEYVSALFPLHPVSGG